ncbi:class I SAM-dependent methyltransferase, partial [Mycobacteroides abscessus subsp. massiliense]
DSETFQRTKAGYRLLARAMSLSPTLRYMAQYHRYAF